MTTKAREELRELIYVLYDSLSKGEFEEDGKKTCVISLKKLPQAYQTEIVDYADTEMKDSKSVDDGFVYLPMEDSLWQVWIEIANGVVKPRGLVTIIDEDSEKYVVIDLIAEVMHSLYAK